jgi:hypothetical protein
MPIPEHIIIPAGKDPGKGHFVVSMAKSAVRIFGSGALIYGGYYLEQWGSWFILAGIAFLIAEILGVIEEIV